MEVTRKCDVCDMVIYAGRCYKYQIINDHCKEDIEGEFFDGCGVCEECLRELCENCAGFDNTGRCRECVEKEEAENGDG